MTTELLLTPVGAGKTASVLNLLLEALNQQPALAFPRVWVLLPNNRQETMFRQRLIEHPAAHRVVFNVEFFDFYQLYERLLDMAGKPQRQLDHTARYRLLRSLLGRLQNQLQVYGQIAQTPGFVDNVASFIYELKQNLVEPDAFANAATTPKDHDLATIYRAYQNTLQDYHLVDREGEGWLALRELEDNPDIAADVHLLLVDGFDQFNPLQARLLARLSAHVGRALVTLPTIPGREETVGRRFRRARHQLEIAHEEYEVPLTIQEDLTGYTFDRHPALNNWLERSFLAGVQPHPSAGCLTLIETPDPASEVNAVLRQVKRRLLVDGCQPDDIILAVRDWARYGGYLAQGARTYGLPIALHYGEALAHNPAIIALMNLLELAKFDFRRRRLIDVLRSPYFAVPGLNNEQIDQLERVSQAQQVIGGQALWLEALELVAAEPPENDEIERYHLDSAIADEIRHALTAFFQAVTPPPQSTIAGYVEWLEKLIGADTTGELDDTPLPGFDGYSLHLLRGLRQGASTTVVSRDLTALQEFKRILWSLLSAQFLAQALGEDPHLAWPVFWQELKTAVGRAKMERRQNRTGRVLITTVENARGLPHRHVFILGLAEGIFPAPTTEDPLYLDSERRRLAQAGIPLETRAERAADDGLFYELVGLARASITLSRPTIQNGAPWPESHLWRQVKAAFSDAEDIIRQHRLGLGSVVPAAEAASAVETLLAVAAGLNQPEPDSSVTGLYNWLVAEQDACWQRVRLGRHIELGRLSRQAHNHYSGRLSQPDLIAGVAQELGPRRVWSASQFNEYGQCGFRFFAKRLLKLEALEEPEEGADALQWGSLNHEILEKTYQQIGLLDKTITPDNTELAVETLYRIAADVLWNAPARYAFRASALWEQEKAILLRKLEALIRLDFSDDNPLAKKFGNDSPRKPYRQEAPFGIDGQLALNFGGERLRVRGYIDRIDRSGDQIILLDYKTGSTGIPRKEMERGRNFQMMLYLLVAPHVLDNDSDPNKPTTVAGGTFWHTGTRSLSGPMRLADEDDAAALETAQAHLERYIRQGRAGNFDVHPNKGDGSCAHYCDFSRLCRVNLTNRFKRED